MRDKRSKKKYRIMGNKITLAQAAQLLANKSGKTRAVCEDFLKNLFSRIASSLQDGETVRIKEFGTFRISTVGSRKSVDVTTGKETLLPEHRKVVFVPAKELAQAVNAPFEMFETTEIEDDLLDSELVEAEADEDQVLSSDIQGMEMIEMEKARAREAEAEQEARAELEPILPKAEEPEKKVTEETADNGQAPEAPEEETPSKSEPESQTENQKDSEKTEAVRPRGFGHGFWWGAAAGLVVILLAGGVIWWMNRDHLMPKETVAVVASEREDPEAADVTSGVAMVQGGSAGAVVNSGMDGIVINDGEVDDVPTQPSDEWPKYDTIGQTRYLGTMAKDYYGNYHFWPYIYEENKEKLGHPDRIRPGTKIKVPDLAKYGVDPGNEVDIERAKKKGAEIYSRYR